jgi:acetyltransferase-like isoleucine patch superfamily enzyme
MHYKTVCYVGGGGKISCDGRVLLGIHKGSYSLTGKPVTIHVCDENSEIHFKGRCDICRGTNIYVRCGGKLVIGDNVWCNCNCNILVNKSVELAKNVIIGWNVTFLDGDGHTIISDGIENTSSLPIYIGEHSWLSANSTILKGVSLAHDTIIPYGSIIYKTNSTPNVIFANKILKYNVKRGN